MSTDLITAEPKTPTTPDAERIWSCLLSTGTLSDKMRRGLLKAADLPTMKALEAEEERRCQPADFETRAAVLEALFQHYPAMPVGDGLTQFLRDWHEDTGHLPAAVLAEACRAYRRSKAQYRPTPGMLLDYVDKNWRIKSAIIKRAITMLEESTVDSLKK